MYDWEKNYSIVYLYTQTSQINCFRRVHKTLRWIGSSDINNIFTKPLVKWWLHFELLSDERSSPWAPCPRLCLWFFLPYYRGITCTYFSGLLYDKLHSYEIAFVAAGVPPVLGALVMCFIPRVKQVSWNDHNLSFHFTSTQ